LRPFEYVFIRDVDTNTTNYYHQADLTALDLHITEVPVILSLEDKSRRPNVPSHWIVLEEPLRDIHSKMFYSKAFFSTGDSMAREAAELGVPAYYLGTRDMPANQVLMDIGYLFQIPIEAVESTLEHLVTDPDLQNETDTRMAKRLNLKKKWDDVNLIILKHIKPYL